MVGEVEVIKEHFSIVYCSGWCLFSWVSFYMQMRQTVLRAKKKHFSFVYCSSGSVCVGLFSYT